MAHHAVASLTACGRRCLLAGGSAASGRGDVPAVGRWNGRRWTASALLARTGINLGTVTSLLATRSGSILATSASLSPHKPATFRLWQYWQRHWTRLRLTVRHHPATVLGLTPIPGTESAWATIAYDGHYTMAEISPVP
jgi:hypothetical protein